MFYPTRNMCDTDTSVSEGPAPDNDDNSDDDMMMMICDNNNGMTTC